jgi:hypothetical protein
MQGGEWKSGLMSNRHVTFACMDYDDELTERDIEMLDFERTWWKHAGVKEQAIRDRFDMSATRYYQLLNELLERPAALTHDPILVKRLKRLRTYRQRQRVARLLGAEYSPVKR